ncbi:hypothetical protein DEO72_LG5g1689 [Vigna unguiculata]|uniref:Uncharacterized protein n=1 Tax=Vigna unguiculata TaxID=3917 RepID=A0A4D6M0K7_VIGUN|nr:hypothetical protein DEO72_LG5g1689 [Vigna unguiculata]
MGYYWGGVSHCLRYVTSSMVKVEVDGWCLRLPLPTMFVARSTLGSYRPTHEPCSYLTSVEGEEKGRVTTTRGGVGTTTRGGVGTRTGDGVGITTGGGVGTITGGGVGTITRGGKGRITGGGVSSKIGTDGDGNGMGTLVEEGDYKGALCVLGIVGGVDVNGIIGGTFIR